MPEQVHMEINRLLQEVSGPISHKADGSGSIIPLPIQIQDGKFVSIYPADVADGKHIFPTPWK